jgi:hypothetical protein
MSDPGRHVRWYRKAWQRLAWVARYGHVSPSDAACWEATDLDAFATALDEILQQENKKPR